MIDHVSWIPEAQGALVTFKGGSVYLMTGLTETETRAWARRADKCCWFNKVLSLRQNYRYTKL